MLRSGWNDFTEGKLLFDDKAAEAVMARYRARGLELMADYEHQSLSQPPVVAPASAKRWIPEVRDGALMASAIQWTERAASMIAAGEYRYWSIACRVDPKTSRVIEVINFGLTNTPAANGLEPLMAASISISGTQPGEEQTMTKSVVVALGLSAELDEAAAIAEAVRLNELRRDVLALTSKSNVPEALGVLRAQAQSHEQVVALSARVRELETEQRKAQFDALLTQGENDRQISPAMAQGEWIKQLRDRADGFDQLRAFLATAPRLVQSSAEAPRESEPGAVDGQFTAEEIQVARGFVGDDPHTIAARIREVRAANVNPLKGAK